MTNALKKYREARGLTQVEAAKLFDVSTRTIQRIERCEKLPRMWEILLRAVTGGESAPICLLGGETINLLFKKKGKEIEKNVMENNPLLRKLSNIYKDEEK